MSHFLINHSKHSHSQFIYNTYGTDLLIPTYKTIQMGVIISFFGYLTYTGRVHDTLVLILTAKTL